MILVYSTSVFAAKFLMSVNPKIAYVLCPSIIGLSSPSPVMLFPMMAEPASPKPRASKWPILVIAASKRTVSKFSDAFA